VFAKFASIILTVSINISHLYLNYLNVSVILEDIMSYFFWSTKFKLINIVLETYWIEIQIHI
jgi:hypothetical protein